MKYGDKFATTAIKLDEQKLDDKDNIIPDDRIEVSEDAYSIGFMIEQLINKIEKARITLK